MNAYRAATVLGKLRMQYETCSEADQILLMDELRNRSVWSVATEDTQYTELHEVQEVQQALDTAIEMLTALTYAEDIKKQAREELRKKRKRAANQAGDGSNEKFPLSKREVLTALGYGVLGGLLAKLLCFLCG